ncbi:MAG: DUF3990 domain-containing protein [Muribaculaceae bacterium]|nr:DUF3990 domain-containing protein [Muribaculaceae bacterium]
MKDLYHGSIYDIDEIDITEGNGYKDFGKGFYATPIKKHADSIAIRNKHITEMRQAKIKQRNPQYKTKVYQAYRYNLEFDDNCIDNPEKLKIKIFEKADREWVRFVLRNREANESMHDYDIVIGPTADENTVTIINSYKDELIASNYSDDLLDALIKELEPENLPKQYFFGTQSALAKLRFKRLRREIIG